MKVLWLSSIAFPEAIQALGITSSSKSSGGWLLASADALSANEEIELAVLFCSTLVSAETVVYGRKIRYFIFPASIHDRGLERAFKKIKMEFNPDIIHIHGTEHRLGYSYIKACGSDKVVLSIQGLLAKVGAHYYDGVSWVEVLKNITIRDIFKGTIFREKKTFLKKAQIEKKLISRVDNVIGRTYFDMSYILSINPQAHYFFCNECLRRAFYSGNWEYDTCKKHTIFMSQASYPVKGLHFVLKALPTIKRIFPDVELRIAGYDVTQISTNHLLKIKRTGYGKLIKKLIDKYEIEDNIKFLGPLDEDDMKCEYLNANVYICASTCENSSNSIGEAQMLGVPYLASYVGGTASIVPRAHYNRLYVYDDVEMLAHKVIEVFRGTWSGAENLDFLFRHQYGCKELVSRTLEIYNQL